MNYGKILVLQSGDVLHEGDLLNHKEYCLLATLNEQTNRPDLELLVCFESSDELDFRFRVLPYGMFWSFFHSIFTIDRFYCFCFFQE